MSFTEEQKAALSAPLNRAHVRHRAQAGRQLSYIEGWWAIAEANRIFGFDAWDRETVELRQLGEVREVDGKFRVAYMAKVRITVRTEDSITDPVVMRDGCGYGSGIDRDLGSAHESALKEAETDAMKRALMTFGNPFGLALYDKEQTQVINGAPEPAIRPMSSAAAKDGPQEPNRDRLMRQAIETGKAVEEGNGVVTAEASLERKVQMIRDAIERSKTAITIRRWLEKPATTQFLRLIDESEASALRTRAFQRIKELEATP